LALLSVPTVKIYENLKIQDGGGCHLEKSKNRHLRRSLTITPVKVIQGHRFLYQLKARMGLPISD